MHTAYTFSPTLKCSPCCCDPSIRLSDAPYPISVGHLQRADCAIHTRRWVLGAVGRTRGGSKDPFESSVHVLASARDPSGSLDVTESGQQAGTGELYTAPSGGSCRVRVGSRGAPGLSGRLSGRGRARLATARRPLH